MSRLTDRVDRFLVLLLALLCLAGAVLIAAWGSRAYTGLPWTGYTRGWPDELDASGVEWAGSQGWWPWALAAAGVLVLVLGLRLLAAHIPRRHIGYLSLPQPGEPTGSLRTIASPVADAAAVALNTRDGIETAYGTVLEEDGVIVMRIDAVLEADADLQVVAADCDEVAAQLRQVIGRDDVRLRIILRVGQRPADRVA